MNSPSTPHTLIAILLLTVAMPMHATTTFNYSYGIGPITVSGSLEGDQNGDFVENVANVSVRFDGTPMNLPGGHVYLYTYGSPPLDAVAGLPVVSFIAERNNFLFLNLPLGTPTAHNQYFFMKDRAITGAYTTAGAHSDFEFDYAGVIDPGSWSLTVVPEPSTIVAGAMLLLPVAASAFRALRNRRVV